jgi:hypothetical protein
VDPALLGLVAATGWGAGINLYLVVVLLGVANRAGVDAVPVGFGDPVVLGVAGALLALEFVADKIPYLDSLWDLAHAAIRPLGAAAVAAFLAGDAQGANTALAAIGAGGLATSSEVAKATTRMAVNTSPEPLSNVGVSLAEDGLVAGLVWLAVTNPVLALVAVAVLLVTGTVLTVVLFRVAQRGWRRWLARRRGRGGAAAPAWPADPPTPPPGS